MSDYIQNMSQNLEKSATEGLFKRHAGKVTSFRNSISDKSMEEIRQVSREFESVFLSQMLKPMFKGLDTAPPFGGGHAEEVFRGLMIDEIGKEFSRSGGIGVSQIIEKELIEMHSEIQSSEMSEDETSRTQDPASAAKAYELPVQAESLPNQNDSTLNQRRE